MQSDGCEQGQTSKPLGVEKLVSTGAVLLMKESGNLLLQFAHAGQHRSMTQLADVTEVKQVTRACADFIHQILDVAVVKAVGEDGADNHDSYRQDISKAGRPRAQNLLVNDAVHLMDGMGVSGSLSDTLAVRWHPSSHC